MALVTSTYIDPEKNTNTAKNAYSHLAQANQAAVAAQQAQTQAAIEGLRGQVPTINEDYDALAKQSYQGLVGQQRGAANQLASAGLYNSGYADTYKTMQQTAYGSQLNAQELERQRQLRALEQQISQTQYGGDVALGQLQQQYASQMAQQMNADRAYQLQLQQMNAARAASGGTGTTAKDMQELDPLQKERGILVARQLINNYSGRTQEGIDFAFKILNDPTAQQVFVKQYGLDAYEAYKNTLLAELPGLSSTPVEQANVWQDQSQAIAAQAFTYDTREQALNWLNSEYKKVDRNGNPVMNANEYITARDMIVDSKKWVEGIKANTNTGTQANINRLAARNAGIHGYSQW